MDKESIRKEYLPKMAALPAGEVEDRSQAIAQLFFNEFKLTKECVHVFLSITKNNEVNTYFIINKILREFNEVKIAVPKSDFSNGKITSYSYDEHTKLKVNKLGIPEPTSGTLISPKKFDIVLVPLLAFDKKGFRVGYGKGFYDRLLAMCKPETLKIGLSLFQPLEEISDVREFDIKLNCCITPEQIYQFN